MSRHQTPSGVGWRSILCLLVGVLLPAAASAEIKLAFIDSDRIFSGYSKTQEVQQAFNREVQEISKQAREMKAEIDSLQKKLDQQSPMLSEAKRDEQSEVIQKKIGSYESFVQSNWGPSGKISKLNEEYLKPIVDRVHGLVAEIAAEEGYTLVLDAAGGNVVYGDKSLDLTDRVLVGLKEQDDGTRPIPTPPPQGAGSGGQASPSR